jgi:predicted ATPase
MKITAIELSNIRGFKLLPKTELSKRINVFIGANNSGKSTILNAIFSLQRAKTLVKTDITIGEKKGEVKLFFEGNFFGLVAKLEPNDSYVFDPENQKRRILNSSGTHTQNPKQISEVEPNNLIYPYLSKRKTVNFNDQINEQNTNTVSGNFANLFSKIDRLVTPQFQPGNTQYLQACRDILGFEISTLASPNGKKGVYFVHNQEHIPLIAMGEGVTNIIGLITDLCVAENKVFLIEEPENDIHPKALKSLLNFIIEKSDTNQFFVSTHSNIVMKYLGGSLESKIFNIKSELSDPNRPNLFISNLKEVPSNIDDRIAVLENLGYEFNDFGLWSAWLFLEESSAEVIIRDNLIRWFVPSLTYKLRTFSAGSTSRIKPKFDDFNKLFVFLHLEPSYKNKVWVYIDGGEEEGGIISDMRQVYKSSGWNTSNFNQFFEHDFEKYYPNRFQEEVDDVIAVSGKQKKRTAKRELLNKVKDWIIENEKEAKEEFKTSASEIIEVLKSIKQELNKST